jgi:hypothetical protein
MLAIGAHRTGSGVLRAQPLPLIVLCGKCTLSVGVCPSHAIHPPIQISRSLSSEDREMPISRQQRLSPTPPACLAKEFKLRLPNQARLRDYVLYKRSCCNDSAFPREELITPPAGGVDESTRRTGTGRPRDAYFAAAAFISDATRLPCKGIQASPPESSPILLQ